MSPPARALSTAAFATLLLIAALMGANHVAARMAFNHGVDVPTAVSFRSGATALVVGAELLADLERSAGEAASPLFAPLRPHLALFIKQLEQHRKP